MKKNHDAPPPSTLTQRISKTLSPKTIMLKKPGDKVPLNNPDLFYVVVEGLCQLTLTSNDKTILGEEYVLAELGAEQVAFGIRAKTHKLFLTFLEKPTVVYACAIEALNALCFKSRSHGPSYHVAQAPQNITLEGKALNIQPNLMSPSVLQEDHGPLILDALWASLDHIAMQQNHFYDEVLQKDYPDIAECHGPMRPNINYSTATLCLVRPTDECSLQYMGLSSIITQNGYFVLAKNNIISTDDTINLHVLDKKTALAKKDAAAMMHDAFITMIGTFEALIIRHQAHEQRQVHHDVTNQDQDISQSMREFMLFVKHGERDSALLKSISDLVYACQVIFDHLGIKNILPDKKKLHIDVNDLDSIAQEANFRYREINLQGAWWKVDHGPLLVYLDDNKPAAMIKEKKEYYLFQHDNAGRGIKVNRDVAVRIQERALYLYPAFPPGVLSFKALLTFSLKAIKHDVMALIVFSLIGGALSLVTPMMSLYVTNLAIPDKNLYLLIIIAVMIVSILLTTTIVKFISAYANLRIDGKLSKFVEPALVDRIMQWPIASLNKFTTAQIYRRVQGITMLKKTVTSMICTGIPSIIFFIYAMSLAIYLLPLAGVVLLAVLLGFLGVAVVLGVIQFKAIFQGERMEGNVFNIVYQSIENMQLIRSCGIESTIFRQWAKGFNELNTRGNNSKKVGNFYQSLMAGFTILMTGITFIGIVFMQSIDISVGVFIAFLYSLSLLFSFSMQLINVVYSALQLYPSLKISKPFLAILPEKKPFQRPAPKLTGLIEVNQAFFRYRPEDKPSVSNIAFTINPGDFVGIVGASGSGKSTILKLLLSIYQPTSGGIYYDRIDLRKIEATSLRTQCGVVLQTSALFPGTLYENIALRRDTTQEKVWEALTYCDLAEDIKQLPMQLHTAINETSSTLSSGQKQRIILARALLGNPDILMLDEPTNMLDTYHANTILRRLGTSNKTRIVVSHNPQELLGANNIIVLDKSEIVEMGSYAELSQNPQGLFAQMLRLSA